MDEGSDVFDRFVMEPNRRVRRWIAESGADLLFHCCGELTDAMIRKFGELDPAILSLGNSRPLWEVAPLVPESTVLFGNLPSKMLLRMKAIGRPFILGSECDILSVKGCECAIHRKVEAFLNA
jgi:hypothetical protein